MKPERVSSSEATAPSAGASRKAFLAACALLGVMIALDWNLRRQLEARQVRDPSGGSFASNGAATNDPHAALRAKLAEVRRRRAEVDAKLAVISRQPEPEDTTTTVILNTGSDDPRRHFARHPDWAPYRQRIQRKFVLQRYGPLFAKLDLPREMLEELKRLLVETQDIAIEVSTALPSESDEAAAVQLEQKLRVELEREIRDLLGEENYERLEQYRLFGRHEERVRTSYGPAFADIGVPLSDHQTSRLAEIIYARQQNRTKGGPFLGVGFNSETGLNDADRKMLYEARTVLQPPQLARLEQFLADDNRRFELRQRYGFPAVNQNR